MSRFLDSARATVMALSSPGSELALGPALASPPLQAPPRLAAPAAARGLDTSQSTDRSYQSLIASALDVINELRERGFASETYQSSRSSSGGGGASETSWRDDHAQASGIGTPYSGGSSQRRSVRRGGDDEIEGVMGASRTARSAELPSSSTKIPAYAAVGRDGVARESRNAAATDVAGASAAAQLAALASGTAQLLSSPYAAPAARSPREPHHAPTWGLLGSSGSGVMAVSPPAGSSAASFDAAASAASDLGRLLRTAGGTGRDPGGQRLLPSGSPPFAYSPEDGDAWDSARRFGASASAAASAPLLRSSHYSLQGGSAAAAPEPHLVPPPLQSPARPATLPPDPETAIIEEAVNEWLDGVAPPLPPPAPPQLRGSPPASERPEPPPRLSPGAAPRSSFAARPSASSGPPLHPLHPPPSKPPTPPAPAGAPPDTAAGSEQGSLALPSAGAGASPPPPPSPGLRPLVARLTAQRPQPEGPASAGELWRMQRAVEAAYHSLVRARRAREAAAAAAGGRTGGGRSSADPRYLPLSAPGATTGGRFAPEAWPPTGARPLLQGGAGSALAAAAAAAPAASPQEALTLLCAELGLDAAEAAAAPGRLVTALRALGRVAVAADTLDRFAERVCGVLGGRLLGPAAATHVGLEQGVVLLEAMVAELEGLRRLRRAGGAAR